MTENLIDDAKNCRLCTAKLPFGANPIFIWPQSPSIILISQAPGRLAHASSLAWNDASGDRLRLWLGVGREVFYKSGKFAVLPMSFCFPGYKNGADAPPIKECAPLWHPKFLASASPKLIIYIGRYAQSYYLGQYNSLTSAVKDFEHLLPGQVALPHPSGRNNRWLSKHSWFEQTSVPALRSCIDDIINTTSGS